MKAKSGNNHLIVGLVIALIACLGICGTCIPWHGLALKEEPFHNPASTGNWPAMQKLLDNGLSVDAEDQNGDTALYFAVSHDHLDFAQKLLDRGANKNHRNHRGFGLADIGRVNRNPKTLHWVEAKLSHSLN